LGAAVALELAVSHPARVRSVVPISASVRADGMPEDLADPPTEQDYADFRDAYLQLSPHPDHYDEFFAALASSAADLKGWSDEQLAAITAPTLIVQGDHDFVTVEHAALMQHLIPGSMLAVLPNTTHMQITRRADLLLPMLADFLD
jgi:pimeloyl-ACP methyl ester carboxylesterase